ncbi:MAG: hypothetical protein PHQ64_00915 [Bacilli bacterium]|nr:hypothetical protein [Bacilli bacterium]
MTKTIIDLITSELNFKEIRDYVSDNMVDYINYIKEEMFIKVYKKIGNKIIISDLQREFENRQDLIKEALN